MVCNHLYFRDVGGLTPREPDPCPPLLRGEAAQPPHAPDRPCASAATRALRLVLGRRPFSAFGAAGDANRWAAA